MLALTDSTKPVTALISWSHADSGWSSGQVQRRQAEVLLLAKMLRQSGIDVELDLYHLSEPVDWTRWGPRMVTDSEFVLVVASHAWSDAWEGRGDPRRGAGAAAEASALRSLEADDRSAFLRKVRLIHLPGSNDDPIPTGLHGIPRYRLLSIDLSGLVELLRDLTGQPEHPKPALGPLPVLPPSVAARMDGEAATAPPSAASNGATEAPTALRYSDLNESVGVTWRADWDPSTSSETTVVVHAIPVPQRGLPGRALATALSSLPDRLRQARAIDPTSAIDPRDDATGVSLIFPEDPRYLRGARPGTSRGIRVDITGQLSAWHTLPADDMGSIIDSDNLIEIIATCLRLLGHTGALRASTAALAVELGPTTMTSRGSTTELGHRKTSSMRVGRETHLRVPPDETVDLSAFEHNADEAAAALTSALLRAYDRT